MKRRKALFLTASLIGGTIIGSDIFLMGCAPNKETKSLFSSTDINVLDEVGETILPETDRSPGAKAAKIGLFMKTIVSDCYTKEEQEIFKSGIVKLNQFAKSSYGSDFLTLDKQQRKNLLVELDKKANEHLEDESPHYFSMMKQLTIWGYFTSEPGATKALRYNPIPGSFAGCVPYIKGEKAWA